MELINRIYNWTVKEAATEAVETPEAPKGVGRFFRHLIVAVADVVFSIFSKHYTQDKETKIAELRNRTFSVLTPSDFGEKSGWRHASPSLKNRVISLQIGMRTNELILESPGEEPLPETEEKLPGEQGGGAYVLGESTAEIDSESLPEVEAAQDVEAQLSPTEEIEQKPSLPVEPDTGIQTEAAQDIEAPPIETPSLPVEPDSGIQTEVPQDIELQPSPPEELQEKLRPKEGASAPWKLPAFKTVLKTAFIGTLMLAGGAAVKKLMEGFGKDTAYTMGAKFDDAKFAVGQQFEEAKLDLHTFTHLRQDSPLHTDYWVDLRLLEKASAKTDHLQEVADKLEAHWNAFSSYFTVEEATEEKICLDTPLAQLIEATSGTEVDDPLLTNILARAVGSMGTVAKPEERRHGTEASIAYLSKCLKLMGNNPEQRKIAAGLAEGLGAVGAYGEKADSCLSEWKAAAVKCERFVTEAPVQGDEEVAPRKPESLESAFIRTASDLKAFLLEKMENANEQGFYLPLEGSGSLVAFVPEGKTGTSARYWTVRLFSTSGRNEPIQGGYRPYREVRGIARDEILDDSVLKDLLSRSMSVRFNPNAYPAAATDIGPDLSKILRNTQPDFLAHFLSTAGRPRTEVLSSLYIHPTGPAADPDALLTDVLHASMGPEAALDYQLATLRHYLEKHGASVGRKPAVYHLLSRSLSSLALISERGSADGWISPEALQEKERIIRECDTVLKHAHLVLKKHLRETAPVVTDETQAMRLPGTGTLPPTEPQPLEKTGTAQMQPPAYRPSISLFPGASNLPPVVPVMLRPDEVGRLAEAIKSKPNDPALTVTFRSWVEAVRQNKDAIGSLTEAEVNSVIGNVAVIAEKLASSKLPEGEATAALADAVAVADVLMRHTGNLNLNTAYLPVGRIAGQFTNPGIFRPDPNAFKEAGTQMPPDGHLYFGEAVVSSKITEPRRLEEFGLPWSDLKMIRSNRPVEDLPPHVLLKALSVGELPKTSSGVVQQAYGSGDHFGRGKAEGAQSKELSDLQKIVGSAAQRSAAAVTKRAQEVLETTERGLVEDPKGVAAAIREWTRYLGYSHIDPLTLEMLSQEQVESLLDSVGKLSTVFIKANYLAGNSLPEPETMLVQIELMAFADRVMAYSPFKMHNHFYMPLESFGPVIDGEIPFFRTLDPVSDNERLQGVRDWLAERRIGYVHDGMFKGFNLKWPLFNYFDGFLSPDSQFVQIMMKMNTHYSSYNAALEEGRFVFPFLLSGHATRNYRLADFMAHDMTNPNALRWELDAYAGTQKDAQVKQAGVPGWFYGLRDLAYYSFHTMRGGLPLIEGRTASPDDLDVEIEVKEHGYFGMTEKYEVIHRLKGITPEDYAKHPDIPDGARIGHTFAHLDPVIESRGVVKELRDLYRIPANRVDYTTSRFGKSQIVDAPEYTSARPGIEIPHRSVYDVNAALVRDAEGSRGVYSSDQYRVKWSLAAEPDLQTFLTLSTYMDNPEWLTHPEEQREFTNLLFDPGLLWRHLQEPNGVGAAAEAELAGFFYNQYHAHAGKPEHQLFFAEMGVRLYQYSAMAREASPQAYAGHPVPKQLQTLWTLPEKILQQPSAEPADKSSYGALRALQYLGKRELSSDEAVDFVKAVLNYRTFAPRIMVNTLHTDRQIDHMMTRFAGSIRKAVYKDGKLDQDAVSRMTRGIIGERETFAADEENPYFLSNPSGSVGINLLEGVVYQEGMRGVFLPAEVRQSQAYAAVFGKQAFRAMIVDRSTYQFSDHGGNIYFAQKAKDGSRWLLYRQFEGTERTYRLVTTDWTEWDAESGRSVPIRWIKSDWILSRHTHWYHEGASPEIRVLDREGNYSYRVSLGGPDGKAIQAAYKVDSQGKDEAILGDVDREEYDWIAQFADKRSAQVWLTKDGKQARELEFPGYGPEGLSFKWTDNGWQHVATPQFFIAPRQLNPLFPGQENFLLLKTAKGGERLLIPRMKPASGMGNTLGVNVPFERKLPAGASYHQLLVFDKDPQSGRFTGIDPESTLYLAMLHLSHRDYFQARTALLEMKELSRGFTHAEKEILDWIVASETLPSDTTSQSIAIRTLAAYVRMDNERKYSDRGVEKDKLLYQCPQPLKEEYLRRFESLGTLRLPLYDEVNLFNDLLISGTEPAEVALAKLQSVDPEAAKEAFDAVLPKLLFGRRAVDLDTAIERADSAINTCAVPFPAAVEQKELDAWIAKLPTDTARQAVPPKVVDEEAEWFKVLSGPTKELMRKYDHGAKVFHESRDHSLYRVEDPAAMRQKRLDLERELQSMTRDMESLRLKVVRFANPLPVNPAEAQKLLLRIEGGTEQPVTFDRVIGAFSQGQLSGYKALNKEISDADAEEIDLALQAFMDMVPAWNHRTAVVKALSAVEEALASSKAADAPSLQEPLHHLISTVGQQRHFSPDAPRLTKVMEYQSGAYYRKVQVTSLENMGIGRDEGFSADDVPPSSVHRVAVGEGKTSRLLPSMARYFAEKGELALVMMPEAQLPSAGREFSQIMKDVYGVSTVTVEVTRNEATLGFLQSLSDQIKEAKQLGKPVLTCSKSVRVLRNLFIENYEAALTRLHKGEPDDGSIGKVNALRQILASIEVKPLIDELHKEYDTRVETNHPFGEAKSLPEAYGVTILNLYEILRDNPQIRTLMHFNFIPDIRVEGAGPFTKERFKQEIAPIVSKAFLERLKAGGSSLDSELIPLADYVVTLNESQLKDLNDYLLQRSSKEVVDAVARLPQQIKDLLALVRGQLNVLMPTALDRNFGEKYGFVSPADVIPTPFSAAGVPNKGSQFSSPYERFDYMVQSLFHEGPRLPMIEAIVRDLRRERAKELSKRVVREGEQEPGVRIETEADKEFSWIFRTETLNLDHEDLETKLMQNVLRNPALMRHLVKTYALPQVKVFPRNLKATSQHLGNMFSGWNGFSGTPNNYPTYPGEFGLPKDEAVIGRMLTLIRENSIGSVHTVKGTATRDLLNSPVCLAADAFIDAGGVFANESLEEVLASWGAASGKATVWVDREAGIVVKQHPEDKPVSLRAVQVPTESRKCFYAQPDITGTDIAHRKNAVGIVSISKGMTFTDLEQAAGRMRGIEKEGQTVELLVMDDDAVVIRQKFGLKPGQELTVDLVMRYLMINESEKLNADSSTALHHKLRGVVDNYFFNWLKGRSPEDIASLDGIDDLLMRVFFPEVATSPFDLYGHADVMVPRENAFDNEIEGLIGTHSPLAGVVRQVFGIEADAILSTLKVRMEALRPNLAYINEMVSSRPPVDMEQEQELLQDQEVEQMVELEQEVNLQQEDQQQKTSDKTSNSHKPWVRLSTRDFASWSFWKDIEYLSLPGFSNTIFFNPDIYLRDDAEVKAIRGLFYRDEILASSNAMMDPRKPRQLAIVVKKIAGPDTPESDYRIILVEPWEAVRVKQALNARDGAKIPAGPFEVGMNPYTYDHAKEINSVKAPRRAPIAGWRLPAGEASVPVPPEQRDAEVWIGDFNGRRAAGDAGALDLQDPKFRFLWIQAQIIAGKTQFTPEEVPLVKEWLEGWLEHLRKFPDPDTPTSREKQLDAAEKFIKRILSEKQDALARYPRSDLAKIFLELRGN